MCYRKTLLKYLNEFIFIMIIMFYYFWLNWSKEHKNWYVNSTYEQDNDDDVLIVWCFYKENCCDQNYAVLVYIQNIMPNHKNIFIILNKSLFTWLNLSAIFIRYWLLNHIWLWQTNVFKDLE